MNGVPDTLYKYYSFDSTTDASVEAIVLDTDVDANHVEFAGLKTTNLFTGNLNPQTSQIMEHMYQVQLLVVLLVVQKIHH